MNAVGTALLRKQHCAFEPPSFTGMTVKAGGGYKQ